MTIALRPKPLLLARAVSSGNEKPLPAAPAKPIDAVEPTAPALVQLQTAASLEVAAPTGLEGRSFAALIARLGLTEAVKDGVITEAEAQAAGLALAPLLAAASREGDTTKLDDYSELLSAAPTHAAVSREQLSAGFKADYVVFAPRSSHEALQPLLAHRSLKGLSVALVDPADVAEVNGKLAPTTADLSALVKRSGARFVMLVGSGRSGEVPADQLEARDYGHAYMNARNINKELAKHPDASFRFREVFASDNAYGLPNKKGVPTVAVGRLPVRSAEELVSVVSRIVDYEAELSGGAWQARVNVADGAPMWGKLKDRAVDEIAEHAIGSGTNAAYDARRISHNPHQPSAPTAPAVQADALRDGGLFFQYFGHGLSMGIDGLSASSVAMLGADPSRPTPLVAIMACLTGQYAGGYGDWGSSLAEELVTRGPALSAIASSDISLPHSNAGLGAAIAEETMSGKTATVGELLVAAKRRYEKNDVKGIAGTISGGGHLAWSAGRIFKKLGDDEKAHLYMYNLIGDPAMELRRPTRVAVGGPRSVNRGEGLSLDVAVPPALRNGVAYVSFDVPGAAGKPGSSSALTVAVPVRDGRLEVQLPPTMRKGRFNVRVAVTAEGEDAAVGVLEGVRVSD